MTDYILNCPIYHLERAENIRYPSSEARGKLETCRPIESSEARGLEVEMDQPISSSESPISYANLHALIFI